MNCPATERLEASHHHFTSYPAWVRKHINEAKYEDNIPNNLSFYCFISCYPTLFPGNGVCWWKGLKANINTQFDISWYNLITSFYCSYAWCVYTLKCSGGCEYSRLTTLGTRIMVRGARTSLEPLFQGSHLNSCLICGEIWSWRCSRKWLINFVPH